MAALLFAACTRTDPLDEIREMHRLGEFEASVTVLRNLIEERPGDPEVQFLYGRALVAVKKPSLALFPLREAMKDPNWIVAAGIQLATGALGTGNGATAAEVLGEVLAAEPDNTTALMMRASARAHTLRDFEGALEDAERALEIDPDYTDALVPRAVALLGLERVAEAGEALNELEERFSDDSLGLSGSPRYCAARGLFAAENGEIEKAEKAFGECLDKFPASSLLVNTAIDFFDRLQRFDRSTEILRAACDAAPANRDFRIALAMRLPIEQAEALLKEPTNSNFIAVVASAWADLASYHIEQGNLSAGVDEFERALALVPEPKPDFLFAMAEVLVRSERFDRALELVDQMSVPAHRAFVRARVHMMRKQWSEALEQFDEGSRLWPDNAVGRYLAALCAEQLGDFSKAIEEYRYSMRIDSGATDSRLRLARLHFAEGFDGLGMTALRHNFANHPPSIEETLLEIEALGRGEADLSKLRAGLVARVRTPELWGRALATYAAGARARGGPKLSARRVQNANDLDLTIPEHAPALISLVGDLVALGETAEAMSLTQAALAAHPDAGAFHEARAIALSGNGSADRAHVAIARALELQPDNLSTRLTAARLSIAAGHTQAALDHLEHAADLDDDDSRAPAAAAELLLSLGRSADAEPLLEEVLARSPYHAASALQLAELLSERGADTVDVTSLARRAVRFGGGPEADALLARLEPETSAGTPP